MKSYLIKNQDGYFLCKSGAWADCTQKQLFFRTSQRDDALNKMVEVNSSDYELRLRVLVVKNDERGNFVIPENEIFVAAEGQLPIVGDDPKDSGQEEADDQLPSAASA